MPIALLCKPELHNFRGWDGAVAPLVPVSASSSVGIVCRTMIVFLCRYFLWYPETMPYSHKRGHFYTFLALNVFKGKLASIPFQNSDDSFECRMQKKSKERDRHHSRLFVSWLYFSVRMSTSFTFHGRLLCIYIYVTEIGSCLPVLRIMGMTFKVLEAEETEKG